MSVRERIQKLKQEQVAKRPAVRLPEPPKRIEVDNLFEATYGRQDYRQRDTVTIERRQLTADDVRAVYGREGME
jgi:hypothetical protein